MLVFPKSKINLGLLITGKRPDGYHNIETVFYPVDLCDALELVPANPDPGKDVLSVTGGIDTGNPIENNVLKAIEATRKRYPIPSLKVHLHKAIPAGAGLGGGSSDAAFMLKALNRAFNLLIPESELRAIAASLGSDIPFFIDCHPSMATGRGEILNHVNISLVGIYIIIVNPGISVSTKEAYHNCNPEDHDFSLSDIICEPVENWKNRLINDFEKTVFSQHPEIGKIKQKLYESGAVYSSMSGSGSSVYGLFNSPPVLPSSLREKVIYSGRL